MVVDRERMCGACWMTMRTNVTERAEDFYCEYVLSGKIQIEVVRESPSILAFHHTQPSYPIHIVIIPKVHIPTLLDVADLALIQEIFEVATSIIRELDLQDSNFRIITNGGAFQDSKHLHFHLVSGSALN